MLTAGTSYNTTFAVLGQNANAGATLGVNYGLSHRTGTFLPIDVGIANPHFTQVSGSVNYVQALPEAFSLTISLSGQWSDTTVPQNQQWVLGGFGNLTAWLPAIMVGDSGSLLRASLATPSWQWSGLTLSGTAFYEAGLVNTYYTPIDRPAYRAASDAGLSISGAWTGGTLATLAYAWPLNTRNVSVSNLNAQGRAHLYFTLGQTF
jgi:hemolysin activation/secretion protein